MPNEPTPKIFQTGAMKQEQGLSAVSSSQTFTSAFATDILTLAATLGLTTGDAVQLSTTGADLPDPLAEDVEYFAIVLTATTLKLATTYANAIAGTPINLTDDGTGTHTMEVHVCQSDGWGGSSAVRTLGANDAFPWINFSNDVQIATEKDSSVVTRAFETTPRMLGKTVSNPLSYYARYKSMNRFHYWMWGFENSITEVVVCRAGSSPFSAAPTIGDTCTDGGANNFKFLRAEVTRTETLYIFEAVDSVTVTGLTITESGGSPWVFTLTSASAVMYEHIYELDSLGRRLRSYTVAELAVLTTLYTTDRRNLMATFGKRLSNYDVRYQNAMCKSFALKLSAAGMATWDCNMSAYTEERSAAADGYSSSTWTLLSGLADTQKVPAHLEYRFGIGETLSAGSEGEIVGLTEVGVSDFSFEVSVPLQELQDTISGLSLAELVIEDKYAVKCVATISRHTASTWQTYRDNQTKLVAQMICNQGDYMQEIMIKEATLSDAGGDDSPVVQEPLALECGYLEGTSEWSEFMNGITELHDSPVIFRVRDDSSVNQMITI